MRPVRLVMQAFGPYAGRQSIDFREAVAAGLFGIYGQTGSGKSTIFSAMTFALFGKRREPSRTPSRCAPTTPHPISPPRWNSYSISVRAAT